MSHVLFRIPQQFGGGTRKVIRGSPAISVQPEASRNVRCAGEVSPSPPWGWGRTSGFGDRPSGVISATISRPFWRAAATSLPTDSGPAGVSKVLRSARAVTVVGRAPVSLPLFGNSQKLWDTGRVETTFEQLLHTQNQLIGQSAPLVCGLLKCLHIIAIV